MYRTTFLTVLWLLACSTTVFADEVYFKNGDRLSGKIVRLTDGKLVLQRIFDEASSTGQNIIFELATGRVRPAPIEQDEVPAEWDQDGKHIFVVREGEQEATIFHVDAVTGRREVWKQVRPADLAGVLSLLHFYVTPSGNAYAYSAARILSQLYVYSEEP